MAQSLLVPFVCSSCGRNLVWASVAANVLCPKCHCWVKPSGEIVQRIELGKVTAPEDEFGQLNLFGQSEL